MYTVFKTFLNANKILCIDNKNNFAYKLKKKKFLAASDETCN